jgi:hypothetical protein
MSERRNESAHACRVWIEVKERLRSEMDARDFNHFVRPMFLLTVLCGEAMLFSLPPNRRISERARTFAKHGPLRGYLQAQGFHLAGFTTYPSDEQLVAMSEKFPEQFAQFPAPLRMRAEAALARWAEEDARDAAEVFGLVG